MNTKETVLNILADLTGSDVSNSMDENLFETGLLDSMGTGYGATITPTPNRIGNYGPSFRI